MIAHLAGVLGFAFVPPLIVYLVYKDRSQFVAEQSKEALNFQIIITIVYLVSIPLACAVIGGFTALLAWIVSLIFSIIGGLEANKGVSYKYPFNYAFVK